jgi:hypothetical protein
MEGVSVILLIVGVALYFVPTIISAVRGKATGDAGVFIVNLLFGWTFIGWLVAFVWACSGRTHADIRLDAQRHAEMLAALGPRRVSPAEFAAQVESLKK